MNPNNQKTSVSFEYATEAAKLGTPEATVLPAGELPAVLGGQPTAAATGPALSPGTTYFYRAVADNQQSKKEGVPVDGPTQEFKTAIAPEAPEASEASPLTATTATLHGVLNPHGTGNPGSYEFLYAQSPSECQGGSASTAEGMTGGEGQAVEAPVTALLPNATYSFCLLARNEAGETAISSPPVTFTTSAVRPSLESEAALNVTETSATLSGKVNPNGAPLSACTFEYGTETAHEAAIPCAQSPADIGAGRTPVAVSAALSGLAAGTSTYHWHLTVTNAAGTETGVDHTFVYPVGAGGLPDGRGYELVTPSEKNGALIGGKFNAANSFAPQIAENGTDMIGVSIQCLAGAESCGALRQSEGEPYEFTRTPAGWVTHALAPPASRFEHSTLYGESANDHTALFSAPSPPNGQDDFYGRGPEGVFTDIGPQAEIAPIKELHLVATGGLSHVAFDGEHLFEPTIGAYEYVGAGNAHPLLVGVSGGQGSTDLISDCEAKLGGGPSQIVNEYGSLSADGRTIYFRSRGGPECFGTGANETTNVPVLELFARIDGEDAAAHTVAISEPDALSPALPDQACKSVECQASITEQANWRNAEFQGASGDGSRMYFTSEQQLTDEAGGGGENLYEFRCDNHCPDPATERVLSDVSESAGGMQVAGGPRVQGVMAVSPDGSHTYFIAQGVLTKELNGEGREAQEGADNLYVRQEGRPVRFIATLPESDQEQWIRGISTVNVTPDGGFLVFTSHGALTADDTRPEGVAQVYRYDAQTGALIRVSVGENGFGDDGNAGNGDAGIRAAGTAFELGVGVGRADPTMSHDGSYVFFESPNALTAGALDDVPAGTAENGHPAKLAENIYEYHNGHVSLISDGRDVTQKSGAFSGPGAVELLGSDATGANVFFATNDQLTLQDTDTQRDYYDARICTEAEPCFTPQAPSPPCNEEACHTPTQPGAPASVPASSTFTGAGNLTPPPPAPPVKPKPLTRAQKLAKALRACRTKHNHAKRSACERAARKRYATKASKTSKRKK